MGSHARDHVISRLDLLDLASSEQKRTKKAAITSLQVKTNHATSAKLTKTILFDRKIFRQNRPKTAYTLIKLSQSNATRSSKKFPATQWTNNPIVWENRPTVNTAQYKTTWLTAISSHIALHFLPRYLRSAASSNMKKNAYCRTLKRTMLVLRNKVQQQKNPLPRSATQWSTSELQAHHCMTTGPWNWLLWSVCLTGKYSVIARIKSFTENWAADFMFSTKFWFLGPISRGKCPFCPLCGRP